MNQDPINNQNLMQIDYARTERIAFLNSISDITIEKISYPTHDLPARRLWTKQTATMNNRAIKAQLIAQRGDHAHWWHVRCILPSVFKSTVTLKQRTFVFPRHHHRRTIASLFFLRNLRFVHTALVHQINRVSLRHAISTMPVNKNI